jgi:2-keto-3-deoxy-L-rhamnonate aldolase RhmA
MKHRIPTMKQRLQQSQDLLLGAFVFSTDAAMPEVYAGAGFDFVIVDMEHGPNDIASTLGHIRSARGAGINAVVRLGASDFANIPRLLDAGCEGIFMPHLGVTRTGSSEALKSMRYHPDGERPTCTGVPAASFGLHTFGEVVTRSNRDVLSVGMVEDRECLARIDQILETEKVDWLMPGPADLSSSLGVHGQVRHPTVLEAVDKVFAAAAKRKIPVGMYINDPDELPEWRKKGARFIILSIDLKWLARTLKTAAEKCRSLAI